MRKSELVGIHDVIVDIRFLEYLEMVMGEALRQMNTPFYKDVNKRKRIDNANIIAKVRRQLMLIVNEHKNEIKRNI